MKVVSPNVCTAALGPWMALWESEIYDFLYEYHFNATLASESGRIAELIVADLVPWLKRWPADALDCLQASLEYYLSYDPGFLGELASRGTGFSTADPIAAVWMPIWGSLFENDPTPAPPEQYLVQSGEESASQPANLDLPSLHWPFSDDVENRQLITGFSARHNYLVVASTDEAIDVLRLPIKRRRLAAGIASFDVALQGIRSIDHASVQAQQDPTSRWTPDPNGGLLPDVGSERTLKRSMYATDRALAHGPLSRDGYEPDAGSLEELLRGLSGAARVMGVEADTAESVVTSAAAMASLDHTAHRQWETLARLAKAVLEALDNDHVIVHPG